MVAPLTLPLSPVGGEGEIFKGEAALRRGEG